MNIDQTTLAWLAKLGLQPHGQTWSIAIKLSTVPMSYWFVSRNKLTPGAVKLTLLAPCHGLSSAQLERHDRTYVVQWNHGVAPVVNADQLKYRKLLRWPALPDLDSFPLLVGQVEAVLGISFIRYADVAARGIRLDRRRIDEQKLRGWLAPCADEWGRYMRDAPSGKAG